jgi:hypothetical protein
MLAFAILIWLRMQAAKPTALAEGATYPQNRNLGNQDLMPQATVKMPQIPQRGTPVMQQGGIPPQLQRGLPVAPQSTIIPTPPPRGKQQPQQTFPSPEPSWPNLSPPTASTAAPFDAIKTSGSLLRDTPPWQPDSSLSSLPVQWPDLNDLGDTGGGWRSSEPRPPQNPAAGPGR